MLQDIVVAKYFLSKDPNRALFNKNVVTRNGRTFYEGNARLNKYLHMAQNFYIAKTGQKLFAENLYAYDNGAVATNVQERYSVLQARKETPSIPPETADFLDRVFVVLQDATLDELIELSHEDSEWIDKQRYYSKEDQVMDSLARAEEYRHQYADILKVMDRIDL